MSGVDKAPQLMSLNPSSFGKITSTGKASKSGGRTARTTRTGSSRTPRTGDSSSNGDGKGKTAYQLQKDLNAANARIKELEKLLKEAGIMY